MESTENAPPTENKTANGNSELAAIVKESQAKIESENLQPPKIKRGPGRPPKNRTETVQTRPGAGAQVQAPSVEPAEPVPTPDIQEYLVGPLIAISNIPAQKHRIPELAFTVEEAGACAHSLQQVLNAFVPDLSKMSPKTAAVLGAAVTFGTIGVSKLQIYQIKRAEMLEHRRAAEAAETKAAGGDVFPTQNIGARPQPAFSQVSP